MKWVSIQFKFLGVGQIELWNRLKWSLGEGGNLESLLLNLAAVNHHPPMHHSGWMVTGCPRFFHWFLLTTLVTTVRFEVFSFSALPFTCDCLFWLFFSSTLTTLTNLHPSCPYLTTNNPITLLDMLMVTYLHTMVVHVAIHPLTYIRISTMSITYEP
jgi:hypothetical protein